MVEQATHNRLVTGSNPVGAIILSLKELAAIQFCSMKVIQQKDLLEVI